MANQESSPTRFRDRFRRRRTLTDEQIRERTIRGIERRELFKNTATLGAATAAVLHFNPLTALAETIIAGSELAETGSPKEAIGVFESQVVFSDEQRERLKNPEKDMISLVFGGAAWRSAVELHKAVAPGLERDNLEVGYVDYSVDGVDMESIAKGIADLQDEFPNLKKIGIYGHSMGTQVAAGALALLRARHHKDINLEYVIMDGTPPDTAATRLAGPAGALYDLDPVIDESVLLTLGTNQVIYHDTFKANSAPPRLLWDEGRVMRNGREYLGYLSTIAEADGTRVYYIRTDDPTKDIMNDPDISEAEYRQMFRYFEAIRMTSNLQAHANPIGNPDEYYEKLRAIPA